MPYAPHSDWSHRTCNCVFEALDPLIQPPYLKQVGRLIALNVQPAPETAGKEIGHIPLHGFDDRHRDEVEYRVVRSPRRKRDGEPVREEEESLARQEKPPSDWHNEESLEVGLKNGVGADIISSRCTISAVDSNYNRSPPPSCYGDSGSLIEQ